MVPREFLYPMVALAFGADLAHNVIEHHSAYREPTENDAARTDPQDTVMRARLATENWDAVSSPRSALLLRRRVQEMSDRARLPHARLDGGSRGCRAGGLPSLAQDREGEYRLRSRLPVQDPLLASASAVVSFAVAPIFAK